MPDQCRILKRLHSKLALVTGAEQGIGLELVSEMALRGCNVIMAGRDMRLLETAKTQILERYSAENIDKNAAKHGSLVRKTLTAIVPGQLITAKLDLASFESISNFLNDVTKKTNAIDIVVCNESIRSETFRESSEGLELQMAINHFGHYILIEGLMDLLLNSPDSKLIVHTAGEYVNGRVDNLEITKENFYSHQAFANSKLAQLMYARYVNSEAANRQKNSTTPTNGQPSPRFRVLIVDPGVVTGLAQKPLALRMFSCGLVKSVRTPWDCVQTTLLAVLDDNIQSGSILVDMMQRQPSDVAADFSKCASLAKYTLQVINTFKSSGAIQRYLRFTK